MLTNLAELKLKNSIVVVGLSMSGICVKYSFVCVELLFSVMYHTRNKQFESSELFTFIYVYVPDSTKQLPNLILTIISEIPLASFSW